MDSQPDGYVPTLTNTQKNNLTNQVDPHTEMSQLLSRSVFHHSVQPLNPKYFIILVSGFPLTNYRTPISVSVPASFIDSFKIIGQPLSQSLTPRQGSIQYQQV